MCICSHIIYESLHFARILCGLICTWLPWFSVTFQSYCNSWVSQFMIIRPLQRLTAISTCLFCRNFLHKKSDSECLYFCKIRHVRPTAIELWCQSLLFQIVLMYFEQYMGIPIWNTIHNALRIIKEYHNVLGSILPQWCCRCSPGQHWLLKDNYPVAIDGTNSYKIIDSTVVRK